MGCLWYVMFECGESVLVLTSSSVQRRYKSVYGEAHCVPGDV